MSVVAAGRSLAFEHEPSPFDLDRLVPGEGPWEMEIGFGKGRYLLEQASSRPRVRFLGIEVASRYFRLAVRRCRRRQLDNLLLLHGEALYLLATALPRAFARAVHVYFPDPWPKSRHQKRRLFDAETVDLVLASLRPGGVLYFATDHEEYGESVAELLDRHPAVHLERRSDPWPEGPRTNYEAKYLRDGRSIVRLEVHLQAPEAEPWQLLHPDGRIGVLVGSRDAGTGGD